MKVKTGDKIRVIAGKEKGKEGKVIKSFPKKQRVVVEGINKITKHQKANQNQKAKKGIVKEEAPLHISNVTRITSSKKSTNVNKQKNTKK